MQRLLLFEKKLKSFFNFHFENNAGLGLYDKKIIFFPSA